MSKLLNITEVMDLFEVRSRQTIYNWVERGELPQPQKKWGSPRWDEEEINRALNEDSTPEMPTK